jgi:hypothetical protein
MASLPDLPQTEIAIVEMTNAFRTDNWLAPLKPNAALTAAARAFADYLGKSGKFGHEADGRHPGQRAAAHGYDSRGFETQQLARSAVEGWKASPGHRVNMLRQHVTEIGVGVVRAPDRNPKFISVQLFGRPQSLKVQFTVANQAGTVVRYKLGEETISLPAWTSVSYTVCLPDKLTFEKAGAAARPQEPRDGDKFVVRAGKGGAVAVDVERK